MFDIAEDWEADAIAAAHIIAGRRRVHGQRNEVRARGPECVRMLAELRQLAEAERSPVATVENQNE